LLADKGVRIHYRQYIGMGIPLTLAAIVCSVLVLLAEVKFFAN